MLDHPLLLTLHAEIDASHFSCIVMEFCRTPQQTASEAYLSRLLKFFFFQRDTIKLKKKNALLFLLSISIIVDLWLFFPPKIYIVVWCYFSDY